MVVHLLALRLLQGKLFKNEKLLSHDDKTVAKSSHQKLVLLKAFILDRSLLPVSWHWHGFFLLHNDVINEVKTHNSEQYCNHLNEERDLLEHFPV